MGKNFLQFCRCAVETKRCMQHSIGRGVVDSLIRGCAARQCSSIVISVEVWVYSKQADAETRIRESEARLTVHTEAKGVQGLTSADLG